MITAMGPALVLCFFRAVGVMGAVPFSEAVLSHSNRLVMALVLVLAAFPGLAPVGQVNAGEVIADLVTGFLIGLPAGLLVSAAAMFGELFDSGRGQSIGSFYDPAEGAHAGSTAGLLRYYVWATLLASGGAEVIISSFVTSYRRIPAGRLFEVAFSRVGLDVLRVITQAVTGAILLFVPFALLFVLVDFSFGLLTKLMPQACFSHEAFGVKTGLGLAALAAVSQAGAESSLAGLCAIHF